ncbi:MAG: hypothetical protein GXO50_02805 [Chlorobi bacterium]|nr:hypothetical protein [Chlorobiota bacterium]
MTFAKQISLGVKAHFKAIELLLSKGFIKYMIFPLLLNVLIFWLGINQIADLAAQARQSFSDWIMLNDANFWGAEYLKDALSGVITVIIYVLFFAGFVYLGAYIVIILLSPLFSVISQKTEKVLTGQSLDYPFEPARFFKDILRGAGIALRNLLLEAIIMFAVFVTGLIFPPLSWLTVIFMFLVSAYFYGFSYMDYSNERYRRSIKESITFMRAHKWLAVINGTLFAIVLLIPYIGVALSAFAAVVSVIAGTVSMVEINKTENPEKNKYLTS